MEPSRERPGAGTLAGLGPILLAAVLGLVLVDAVRWSRSAEALEGPDRLRGLDGRCIDAEIAALHVDESLGEIPPATLDLYWDGLQRLAAGTSREKAVRAAREANRQEREIRRSRDAAGLAGVAEDRIRAGHLVEAARLALDLPPALAGTGAGRDLRRAIGKLLLERGLVLVAPGRRTIGGGGDPVVVDVPALLVDVGTGAADEPLASAEARARSDGKRLLFLEERLAVEEDLRKAGATGGIEDRLEWVLPGSASQPAPAGLAWCVGWIPAEGGRPVPVPVARRAGQGHPDVVARSALPVPPAPAPAR